MKFLKNQYLEPLMKYLKEPRHIYFAKNQEHTESSRSVAEIETGMIALEKEIASPLEEL